MWSTRAGVLAITAALVATVAVTACNGGPASTAAAHGNCAAAPGVTADSVTYGLLYPAAGMNSTTLIPYRAGVDARLGVANAQGGIHGRKVGYKWSDDGGQAATNLAAAQHMVNNENVFLIQEFALAPEGSAAWLNQRDVPVVGTANGVVFAQYRNMFSYFTIFTPSGSISTWGDYAKMQHTKKAAIVFSKVKSASGVVAGQALQKSMKAAGIDTDMVEVEPTSLDLASAVRQIRDSGADMITGILDGDTFFQIAVALRAQDPSIKILSLIGYDPAVLALGRQLAGMSVFIGYRPFEQRYAAQENFLRAMAEYAPAQQPAANEIALDGWIDTDLMLRGLQAAGPCPTRQSFVTNLRAVSDYDAGGLLTNPVNMTTSFGKLTTCYTFVQISPDGKRFTVADGKLCGRPLQ